MLVGGGMTGDKIKLGEIDQIIVKTPNTHGKKKHQDRFGHKQNKGVEETENKNKDKKTTVMSSGNNFGENKIEDGASDGGKSDNQTHLGIGKTSVGDKNGSNKGNNAVKQGPEEDHGGEEKKQGHKNIVSGQ